MTEVISRYDVCHFVAWDLMDNSSRGLTVKASHYRCLLFAFRQLLLGSMPATADILLRMGALDDIYLNLLFLDWFRNVLPMASVLRMTDAFLLEGEKILIRYGVALVRGYKRAIKRLEYANADAFWSAIQRDKLSNNGNGTLFLSQTIHEVAFDTERSSWQKLRRPLAISRSNLSKLKKAAVSAVGPSLLSTPLTLPYFPPGVMIQPVLSSYSLPEGQGERDTNNAAVPNNTANVIVDNNAIRFQTAQETKPNVLNLLSRSENSESSKTAGSTMVMSLPPALSPSSNTTLRSLIATSNIIDERNVLTLLELMQTSLGLGGQVSLNAQPKNPGNVLPVSQQGMVLDLVFSSTKDGFDLGTLYRKAGDSSHLILLIKSLSSSQPIVGAYLDSHMMRPSLSCRGSSQTFLFTISQTDAKAEVHYAVEKDYSSAQMGSRRSSRIVVASSSSALGWSDPASPLDSYINPIFTNTYFLPSLTYKTIFCPVASLAAEQSTPRSAGAGALSESLSNDSMSSEDRMRLRGAQIQYAVCSPNYLSFGASLSHATNAIRIDSDLRVCVCGPSDTFGNDNNNIISDSEPTEIRFQDTRLTAGTPTPFASSSSAFSVGTDRTCSFDIKEVEVFILRNLYDV